MKQKMIFTIVLIVVLGLVQCAAAEITIGVLAKRGANRVIAQWGPTGDYLSGQLGEPVVIIPIPFELIETMVKNGRIDFLLANSAFFVEMQQRYKARAIATLINAKNDTALDQFGGVIFTRRDSPIRELADLHGKRFMVVRSSSFGGGQMVLRLLHDNGIYLCRENGALLLEAGTHDNVVYAVRKGSADAGTVRTDTLERMEAEGKVRMSEFRIIHRVTDDFPFVHSTRLYPEWPMAALRQTPSALAARMGKALRGMSGELPAARAASIRGWKEPADYSSVWQCLGRLSECTQSDD